MSSDGNGDPRLRAAWPQATPEEARAQRDAMLEQARPEHEKVVVVRVPTAAPVFQAKLPQERWLAFLMILPTFYVCYYVSVLLMALLGNVGGAPLACAASVAFIALAVGLVVRRLLTRPEVQLDQQGLRYKTTGLFGSSGTIALDHIRGFTVQVKRRAMDNNEQWHLFVTLGDNKSVLVGKTGKHDEASAIIRGLEETLAQLRLSATNYRVGF